MSRSARRFALDDALEAALPFVEELSGTFGGAFLAGSVRRMSPTVGDIDVVVPSRSIDPGSICRALARVGLVVGADEGNSIDRPRVGHVVSSSGLEIEIDVWMVPQAAVGSALLHATGSGFFNAIVRRWARERGMVLDVYGVHRRAETIASKTEGDCFAALGLPFFRPQDRHELTLEPFIAEMNSRPGGA